VILFDGGFDFWIIGPTADFKATGRGTFDGPNMSDHVPQRAVDNLDQIKLWLDTCVQNHELCHTWLTKLDSREHRPSRILELMSDRVTLCCDLDNIKDFKYLTLSHIWGTDASQQLRLTTSRLEEFQVWIPMSEFPDLFKEAIRITHHLGFKYLWIDSLCIIQDSISDWEIEASRMAAVYSNAVASIAFLFPPREGFVKPREDPRTIAPCIIRTGIAHSNAVYVALSARNHMGWRSSKEWPWSSRAWVSCPHTVHSVVVQYNVDFDYRVWNLSDYVTDTHVL
jgi:hypothetical protein